MSDIIELFNGGEEFYAPLELLFCCRYMSAK